MFQRRRIIAAFFARPPGAGKGGGGEGGRVEFRRVLFRSTLSAAEGFLGMTARGSGSQRLHVPAAQDHRRVVAVATAGVDERIIARKVLLAGCEAHPARNRSDA